MRPNPKLIDAIAESVEADPPSLGRLEDHHPIFARDAELVGADRYEAVQLQLEHHTQREHEQRRAEHEAQQRDLLGAVQRIAVQWGSQPRRSSCRSSSTSSTT